MFNCQGLFSAVKAFLLKDFAVVVDTPPGLLHTRWTCLDVGAAVVHLI